MPETGALPDGWRLVGFASLDSTNDEALRRIDSGEDPGLVIVADSQRGGRGRRGAVWQSAPGNLYMTMVVAVPTGNMPGQLAFVAGLAAADAIRFCAGQDVHLKWPNDVMLEGRKLGGILIEAGSREGLYAVGVGLNVTVSPRETETPATALAEFGDCPPRDRLVAALCTAFAERLHLWLETGFVAIRRDWLAVAFGLGRPLHARLADGTEERGLFSAVDETGALVLQREDGTDLVLSAGAVFFDEGC